MMFVNRFVQLVDEPQPCWLDDSTAAVPAALYQHLDGDDGPGGITRGDILQADIGPLCCFNIGAEIYVESTDNEDVLDDTNETMESATRIWWRAILAEP